MARFAERAGSSSAWWPALLFALVVAVVYGNSFLNDWTYDDYHLIVANPAVQSLDGLLSSTQKWRFLRNVSLFVDHSLWGTSPAGYHVQQLLLHWLNGLLVWRLCSALGGTPLAALFGSLLFIVHPLQVESIANISHRKEPLALLFVLLMLFLYRTALQRSGIGRLLLLGVAAAAFLLAVLANETAVTAPLLLVVYEALFCRPEQKLLLRRPAVLLVAMAALAVAGAVYLATNFSLQEQLFKVYSKQAFFASPTYLPLFLACLQVIALYVVKLFWPLHLAPEYVIGFSASFWQPLAVAGAFVALALLVAAFLLRESRPLIAFGAVACCILYLPVANFFPVGYMMADRYLYLPLAGLAFVVAGTVSTLQRRSIYVICGTAGLLILGVLSVRQGAIWRSEHTLWRHAATVNPGSSWVQGAAAKSYLRTGEVAAARDHALRAIRIDRQNAGAYLTLARAEERSGNLSAAVEHYVTFQAIGTVEYPREVADVTSYLPYLQRRLAQGQ